MFLLTKECHHTVIYINTVHCASVEHAAAGQGGTGCLLCFADCKICSSLFSVMQPDEACCPGPEVAR